MSQPDRPFNLEAFSGPFHSESDRACAVLGAALVDERIGDSLSVDFILQQENL